MENQIRCPKCGSTQISANKKGFSGKKAVAGAVLTGGIGVLAGTIGSNKILITCLNCGNQFKPGTSVSRIVPTPPKLIWDEKTKQHIKNPNYQSPSEIIPLALVVLVLVAIVIWMMFSF